MKTNSSVSIQEIADGLQLDTGMVKHALTHLCTLNYCEQIPLVLTGKKCSGCCTDSCISIDYGSEHKANFWQLTDKGKKYLQKGE